ncbi:MAG: Zn-ribbon domain-containing OB-fold protein [Bacteroidales bacterium]|jgi:hypothetical protein
MEVARHWRETPERYRLEAGKCKKCGKITFPQRLICPECGSEEFTKFNLSGKGKIETFTIIRTAPDGFEDLAPYAVGIIALDEGIRILAQITDCNPEELKIGDRLVSKFRRMNQDGQNGMIYYAYKFVPDIGL